MVTGDFPPFPPQYDICLIIFSCAWIITRNPPLSMVAAEKMNHAVKLLRLNASPIDAIASKSSTPTWKSTAHVVISTLHTAWQYGESRQHSDVQQQSQQRELPCPPFARKLSS
eukprot:CAMPEP_0182805184 /NCGR_PEP_ID=MMETSP0006_2-20121128/4941_1 /TAXON_ID=97485 /ORGANISM="Prymnesium parvum, Strain Texoma1" /LENGTH=112 /DNA_ID=CAMNT_0024930737 /DNA_START=620 /DNA_END=954 /DNA_ORIENTATION=+